MIRRLPPVFRRRRASRPPRCRGSWRWRKIILNSRPTRCSATCRRSSKARKTASRWRATATSRPCRSTTSQCAPSPPISPRSCSAIRPRPTSAWRTSRRSRRHPGWISAASPAAARSPRPHAEVNRRVGAIIAARLTRWLLLAVCLGMTPWAAADVPVPPLTAHVTDLTNTLAPGRRAALEQTLTAFELQRGAQLAEQIVPTTAPETIEQYSIRVVEQWKLGRKKVDDGVLLLVAKQDRALRIEVGYGLEGVIPDAVANRVVYDVIVPHFNQGDYAGGSEAGGQQLMKLIESEALPAPARGASKAGALEARLPILFVVTLIGGMVLRALFGRLTGAGLAGVGAGILAWFLFGSVLFGALLGVFAFFFLLGGGFYPGLGGWGSPPRGGSGGFGGGGFGGGGGGFGGGGASGSWYVCNAGYALS